MTNRSQDWQRQAERDFEQAQESRGTGRHEWACFAAQQAAEKAVKALHLHLGQQAWGHDVAGLLRDLPPEANVPSHLVDKALVLDNFYIPSRYPDGHVTSAPYETLRPYPES